MVLPAMLVLALAYWVNKKQINLAGVTIGVDFAQVIAMFAAMDFAWPSVLRDSMATVSAANFNVQILAPECTATFKYEHKWAVLQSLPLGALCVAGMVAGAMWLPTLFRRRQ